MVALFPHAGQYEVRIVAYGSSFLDQVLASAVGLEEQVMILAAQPRGPEYEYKSDFKQYLTEKP